MLKPFSLEYYPLLEGWVTDKEILFQYSGTYFSYPITKVQITRYLENHPDRKLYIGFTDDDVPYAFGEIIPKEDNPPRLARILVGDPAQRGKGLGEKFVRELIREAEVQLQARIIDLFVLEDNQSAIRCYQKVGFRFLADEGFTLEFEGRQYPLKKMRLVKESASPVY